MVLTSVCGVILCACFHTCVVCDCIYACVISCSYVVLIWRCVKLVVCVFSYSSVQVVAYGFVFIWCALFSHCCF